VAFGDPPPCDQCRERSVVRIVTVVFDGPSPADQFLCRVHAPANVAPVAGESPPEAGVNSPGLRTGSPIPGGTNLSPRNGPQSKTVHLSAGRKD
jgi:hypothetical protein